MSRFYSLFLTLVTLIFLALPVQAQVERDDWYVQDFRTEINLAIDETLTITEDILADAGNLPDKHGIFRVFPKKFTTTTYSEELPLEIIEVSNGQGQAWSYKKEQQSGAWVLKIGDPDVSVSGVNHFRLVYKTENSVQNYETADELAWNILGADWQLEIDNFSARITFPEGINKDNTKITVSSGSLGNTENPLTSWQWLDKQNLEITSLGAIRPGEAITVSAFFPKGIVSPVSLPVEPINPWRSIIGSVSLVILAIFIWLFSWRRWGKQPVQKQSVIAEYDVPDDLSPLEINAISNRGSLTSPAIAATLINLGVKNYLTIDKEKGRFSDKIYFKRTDKVLTNDLYFAEAEILEKIFKGGPTVELKKISGLSSLMMKLNNSLKKDLKTRGLISLPPRPYSVRLRFAAALILIGSLFFWDLAIFLVALAIALTFLFVSYSDNLSPAGAALNQKIKGFKLYLDTAEKYRARFQERQGDLTKILPYAIVFGLTKQWLRLMEKVQEENPNLVIYPVFLGSGWNLADLHELTGAIESVTAAVSSHVSTSTMSAGGGAGGGGGGGW